MFPPRCIFFSFFPSFTLSFFFKLSIIDHETFKLITPKEFFKLAWSKKDALDRAPHITTLIRRSTQLTSFVCAKILEETDLKQRSEVLKHFILVADVSFFELWKPCGPRF